jgi:2-(1,2-epoxy-1,2-dihydrophenyl)acetyl-CoA isomerase
MGHSSARGEAVAYSTILCDLADGVATLTFDRPEVRNACNDVMAVEVQAALKSAERDETVRCLVITGAGQDLGPVRGHAGTISFHEHLLITYNSIVLKLRSIEKPVIAAINGAAAGWA